MAGRLEPLMQEAEHGRAPDAIEVRLADAHGGEPKRHAHQRQAGRASLRAARRPTICEAVCGALARRHAEVGELLGVPER